MAEAFGVGAGILTVIELTAKITSRCKYLIETAQDAPRDLRHIFVEISSLKSVLESFQFLFESESGFSDTVQNLGNVDGTVQGCRTTVEDLARELDGISLSQGSQTTVGKRQKIRGSLNWCLKESKARKLLADIAQHKATITLTLLSDLT